MTMRHNQETSQFASFFQKMEQSQRANEQRVDQCVIPHLESGVLPTPEGVRNAINSLVGERRQKLLRYHTFWCECTLRKGLDSLVNSAHQASIDVSRHDVALGALADSADFQSKVDFAVGHFAQKDVFAYCALAFGVRDALKELRDLRRDVANEISEAQNRVYRTDISEFLRKLRNNLLHGRVLLPQWSVSFDARRRTKSGSMRYSVEELMASGRWNAQAISYIQSSAGGHLRLSVAVRDHFKLLNDLMSTLNALFARNRSQSERDYWDIEDSHKRVLRRQWAKILVGQVWKGKDPYDQLHRFFEPEELREILRHTRHSKEQVDFMIALKSAEIDWDHELRQLLYQVFGVVCTSSG